MTINEVMARYNFITKINYADNEKSLDKKLRVKLMKMRIDYNKVKNEVESDAEVFIENLLTEDIKKLARKPNKTEEDLKQIQEYNNQVTEDYKEYLAQKGQQEILPNEYLTESEYNQILEVNTDMDVEINGVKLNAADFMETFYELFVK